jgi:hypothetical protein
MATPDEMTTLVLAALRERTGPTLDEWAAAGPGHLVALVTRPGG